MQATDVAECADMVAAHPLIGPRYGASIKHLAPAWLQLAERQAMRAIVFEELEGTRVILWGLGVTVVVEDRFLNELKSAPFWFGPELATRIVQGRSPVLSDKKFWEANSKEGLNLIVWEGFPRQGFDHRSELYQKLVTLFIEVHRGLFWREAITAQCETAQRLDWAMGAGGMLWDLSKPLFRLAG